MHGLGHTRSRKGRDYLLQTPDTFVRTPLPGLVGGMAIVHASPGMGAGFSMMTLELEHGGKLHAGPAQRFLYVLEGEVQLREPGARLHQLGPGGFVYLPTRHPHTLEAPTGARLVTLEKPYQPLHPDHVSAHAATAAAFLLKSEPEIAPSPLNGDNDLLVRALLPSSMAFDFAVNTMTYAPGAALAQTEIHYMEHGLLMLEGGGIYRLGDDWHPVTTGDVIWMAPFCPQWFGAIGKTPAKYLIYKNFHRHVLS